MGRHDSHVGACGRPDPRIGWTEDGDGGPAEGGCDVRNPRVVSHVRVAGGQHGGQLYNGYVLHHGRLGLREAEPDFTASRHWASVPVITANWTPRINVSVSTNGIPADT